MTEEKHKRKQPEYIAIKEISPTSSLQDADEQAAELARNDVGGSYIVCRVVGKPFKAHHVDEVIIKRA